MPWRPAPVVAAAVFILFWWSGVAAAGWSQLDGPERPNVTALGFDGVVLLQGSGRADSGDLFRSTDGGITWHNAGLPNGGVATIFPFQGDVFVGSYLGGLHRSSDHGLTWEHVASGLPVSDSYAAMAASGQTLFVGAEDFPGRQVFRSSDGGDTWAVLPASPTLRTTAMAIHGGTLFVGSDGDGIHRSPDGGDSWFESNVGLPAGARVAALLPDGARVLAGISHPGDGSAIGLYESIDGGSSWHRISVDLPTGIGLRFTSLAAASGLLYAGLSSQFQDEGLYLSSDGGVHWDRISAGIVGDGDIDDVLVLGSEVFVATGQGAYRTADDGGSWGYAGHGTAAIRGVQALLTHAGEPVVGLTSTAGAGRGIWRTIDAGETWHGEATVPAGAAWAFHAHDGVLLAALYGAIRGVYRSTDGGETWQPHNVGMDVATIVYCLHQHGPVLLAGAYEALYRSTDDGATWGRDGTMPEVTSLVSNGPELYAGRYSEGVWASTDGGQSWSPMNQGLPASAMTINALVWHDGAVSAGTNGGGVRRWDGVSWTAAGLAGQFVNALLPLPGGLLAGVTLGTKLLVRRDGEASWLPVDDGYHGGEPYSLATDSTSTFVGSRGHAIWMRELAELLPAIFADGFESGDATAWSSSMP